MDLLNAIVALTNFVIVPAVSYGSQLALGALGVTLIYGILRFSNFAHGDTMAFGAMVTILFTWWFQGMGLPLGPLPTALLALPFGIAVTALLLIGTDRVVYRFYREQKAKPVINKGEGLIGRLPDSSEDPIAVFKWKESVCAVRDICPHAGFSLADGEFDSDSGVVTCPEHGSRFHVCTGERIRGPADYPLKKYRAFQDGEEIQVEIEQTE